MRHNAVTAAIIALAMNTASALSISEGAALRSPQPSPPSRARSCAGRVARRRMVGTALSATGLLVAGPAHAEKSRSDGYAVQRSDREWAYVLSGPQYYILRQGGTEQPNTSPLYTEKRAGTFTCAGCGTALFSSDAKFNSGTGWPSFATALPAVEVVKNNPLLAAVGGTEVRCGTCGGHLGDVFADGLLFQGTPAAVSGKRFCIDGGALAFRPADGGEVVYGEAPAANPVVLPSWLQPPKVGNARSGGVSRAY